MNETTPGDTPPTPPTAPPPPAPPAGTTPPPPFSPGPANHGPRPQDRFFDGIRGIGLRRSPHRVVGGVSGGIAERTGIDVTVVRVLTVVLAIFGGLGILAYGLAWLFLPEPDGRIHAEQVLRGDVSAGSVGAIIMSVLSLGSVGGGWHNGPFSVGWHSGGLWGLFWGLSGTALFLGAVALVIYLVARGRSSAPGGSTPGGYGTPYAGPTPSYGGPTAPPAPPTPPYGGPTPPSSGPAAPYASFGGPTTMTAPAPAPATTPVPAPPANPRRKPFGAFGALAVAGLAVVGAGVTALVMSNGNYEAGTAVMAWAVALAILGGALVVGGLAGRRAGIIGLFAVVAVIGTLVATVVPKLNHLQGAGDRTWRPATVSTATDGYGLGVGDATLDLTGLAPGELNASNPADISVSVGIGQLTIQVPTGTAVEVRSSIGAGDIQRVSGFDQGPLLNDNNSGVFVGDSHGDGGLSGVGVHRTVLTGTGPAQLIVEAKVGLGEIQVEEVP